LQDKQYEENREMIKEMTYTMSTQYQYHTNTYNKNSSGDEITNVNFCTTTTYM